MDTAQRVMPAGLLPTEAVPLIGRDELLHAACTLLRDDAVHLLTLTGPAGGGKTRLALAAARAQAPQFRHGVRFVDLAPVRDPAMVIPAIAAALGVREAGERSLPARVHRALRDRHVLLVLDNFEQVLPAAPRVGELLSACPGVRALVTSRAALHLRWEHELAVPPLAVPDLAHLPPPDELASIPAVALFLYRAQAVQREFALDADSAAPVAEVCARLDGLPLAIELAAARVKVLPPTALLARLERRLGLLVGGGPDRPTRHQTLRAALDWSHDLLDPRQQALLRRLAVFAGGYTLAAAEAVCADQTDGGSTDDGGARDGDGRPDDPTAPAAASAAAPALPGGAPAVVRREDVLDALDVLVNNSLVRPAQVVGGEPRYALLETVREYAAERLAASGEAGRLNGRHTAYFLALAEAGAGALRGAAQAEWLSLLDREHGNLRTALSRGLAATGAVDGDGEGFTGDQGAHAGGPGAPAGLRLAGALAPFWRIRGHLSEGQRWLEALLAGAPAAPVAVRARALLGAGELAQAGADWGQARAWLEEGLVLSRQVGDAGLIGRTARALGQALLDAGEVAGSRPLLEEGVVRLRAAGGPGDLGDALLALAALAQAGGDLRQTRDLLAEALEVGQRDGDGTIVATARCDLGRILMFQGERASARTQLEEGLRVAEALGSPLLLMKLHRWLGSMATQDGDAAGSQRHLQASLSHAREADDLSGVAYALAALGELGLRVGDPQAVALLEESRRQFTELRFPWGQGRALRGLATAAHRRGDAPAALALLREELALWRDLDDGLGIAGALERVARVLEAQGQTATAARLTGAAVAIRERLGAAGPDGQPLEAISAAHTGHGAWQSAFVAGRALTQADAIAEALSLALAAGDEPAAGDAAASPAGALPFDLTPREAEVLQLLAEGASDAEIAERLIISVRTVNRHVANILGKTGAPNRTAAASLALRQGFS